jgi:hypothetical protein
MERYFVGRGFDPNVNWAVDAWVRNRSQGVYADYLLSHPGYTLFGPFHGHQQALYSTSDNAASLIDPNLSIYNDNASHRFLPLPSQLDRVFFPRGIPLMLALLAIVLVAAGFVAWFLGWSLVWLVPLGILLTTYPHFLVAWHESGVEVDRHAFEAALLVRLATALLALFALDRAVTGSLRALSRSEGSAAALVQRLDDELRRLRSPLGGQLPPP